MFGNPAPQDLEALQQVVDDINSTQSSITLTIVEEYPNIKLYFVPLEDFSLYVINPTPNNWGLFYYWWDNYAITRATLFLSFGFMLLFPDANFVGIFSIIVLDIFIKFIYQCCFYMKTDVYYVVENVTGCYNLMESGKIYLSSFFKKHRKSVKDRGE